MQRLFSRLPVCFGVLLSLVACDDEDEGSGYVQSCANSCKRLHNCLSSVDEASCRSSCERELESFGDNLRPDYVAATDACIEKLTCDQLAINSFSQTCRNEAEARLAASQAAIRLCEGVSASLKTCTGLDVGTAGCIGNVKIFADRPLRSALTCQDLPCDQQADCAYEALGIRLVRDR
jgi:hypothetical protein